MIEPPADKKEFFWNHMNLDIKNASEILNINKDEVMLLLHTVCTDILKSFNNSKPDSWFTKADRQLWELAFSEAFLKPVLKVNINFNYF